MDINVDLFQWSINFFGKKTLGGTVKKENIWKKELAEELHKPVVRKFEKRKVHLHFIGNIWDADLTDMQLMSTFNKAIRFGVRKIPPWSIPPPLPRWIPTWVRVTLGGIWSEGIHRWGNWPGRNFLVPSFFIMRYWYF